MELQEQLELFDHTESDKVLNTIHTEVREQLRKCLDSEEWKQLEAGQNFWVYNFLR